VTPKVNSSKSLTGLMLKNISNGLQHRGGFQQQLDIVILRMSKSFQADGLQGLVSGSPVHTHSMTNVATRCKIQTFLMRQRCRDSFYTE